MRKVCGWVGGQCERACCVRAVCVHACVHCVCVWWCGGARPCRQQQPPPSPPPKAGEGASPSPSRPAPPPAPAPAPAPPAVAAPLPGGQGQTGRRPACPPNWRWERVRGGAEVGGGRGAGRGGLGWGGGGGGGLGGYARAAAPGLGLRQRLGRVALQPHFGAPGHRADRQRWGQVCWLHLPVRCPLMHAPSDGCGTAPHSTTRLHVCQRPRRCAHQKLSSKRLCTASYSAFRVLMNSVTSGGPGSGGKGATGGAIAEVAAGLVGRGGQRCPISLAIGT